MTEGSVDAYAKACETSSSGRMRIGSLPYSGAARFLRLLLLRRSLLERSTRLPISRCSLKVMACRSIAAGW